MLYTVTLAIGAALALNLVTAVGDAGSPVPDSKLKRDLDAQLPAESRYAFPQVSEKWIKTLRYVDPILLELHEPEKVSEEEKKRFNKEEVLSETGKEEGDRRVLTYDPAGKLRSIGDWRGDNEFRLGSYANGAIADFAHWRKGMMVEAYTASLDGKEIHRVVRGNGMLKFHSVHGADFTQAAYHQGEEFFRGAYTGEKLDFVWLKLDTERLLRWRAGSERFSIHDTKTIWSRDLKGKMALRRLNGEYDLKKIDPDLVKLWEGKYSENLAAFLDRYEKHLAKAGYTWEKLGIGFVRMEKPFPDR